MLLPLWKIQYVGSHTGQCCIHELWSIYHFMHQSVDILICVRISLQFWVCARVKTCAGAGYRMCGQK